jgi:hypothetical protein
MAKQRKLFMTHAGELAHRLVRAVRPHAMIADFASSYAQRQGRAGVVDQPQRVHELESTLGREAVLVMVAEVHRLLPAALGVHKGRPLAPEQAAFAQMFWPEFMSALGRALEWSPAEFAGEREALERDLLMYRRWSERAPFPGAPVQQDGPSPFLDRCALLLDPSTMEEARLAAAKFERQLVEGAAHILGHLGRPSEQRPKPKKRRRVRAPSRKPARVKKKSRKRTKPSKRRRHG